MAYLAHLNPLLTHWITIGVMGFSALGAIRTMTRVKDLGVAAMAVGIVAMAGWTRRIAA